MLVNGYEMGKLEPIPENFDGNWEWGATLVSLAEINADEIWEQGGRYYMPDEQEPDWFWILRHKSNYPQQTTNASN